MTEWNDGNPSTCPSANEHRECNKRWRAADKRAEAAEQTANKYRRMYQEKAEWFAAAQAENKRLRVMHAYICRLCVVEWHSPEEPRGICPQCLRETDVRLLECGCNWCKIADLEGQLAVALDVLPVAQKLVESANVKLEMAEDLAMEWRDRVLAAEAIIAAVRPIASELSDDGLEYTFPKRLMRPLDVALDDYEAAFPEPVAGYPEQPS